MKQPNKHTKQIMLSSSRQLLYKSLHGRNRRRLTQCVSTLITGSNRNRSICTGIDIMPSSTSSTGTPHGKKLRSSVNRVEARNFWGIFSSTKNPILEAQTQYMNYAEIRPDHIKEAARTFQVQYETDLESLNASLNETITETETVTATGTEHNLFSELERISRPLTNLQNIIATLSCVMKDPAMNDALHEANEIIQIDRRAWKMLPNIQKEIIKISKSTSADTDEEERRIAAGFLRKQRLNGFGDNDADDNDELIQEIDNFQKRLAETQSRFMKRSSLTMEEHGTAATPQELIPIMYEIVALQQHLSKLLGYPSYAEFSFDYHNSMLRSKDDIDAIHRLFEEQCVEKFSSDDFQSLYIDLIGSDSDSDDKLNEYFELNSVLKELFELSKTLFGVRIEEQYAEINGWHPDVRLFHVFEAEESADVEVEVEAEKEEEKEPIASFYLDPFRRKNKDRGCFMAPIQYKNNDNVPIIAISMDIKSPMWDDAPIGLELDNVVNIYHEFGHALQHMLADVKLGEFSGAQMIEEDTSEIMSQFMEYWLFEGNGLLNFGRHKDTGLEIPQEVMTKIKRRRKVTKANELLHRLFLGSLESELNSKFDPHGEESIVSIQRKLALRCCPHFLPPKGNIDPLIQIFQNDAVGKKSMQYRYLLSEISSADAFAAFTNDETGAMKCKQEIEETGRRMRDNFLRPGASKSASNAYESFRGRTADAGNLLSRYDF